MPNSPTTSEVTSDDVSLSLDEYDFMTTKHRVFSNKLDDVQLKFRYFLVPAYLVIWGTISIVYLAF